MAANQDGLLLEPAISVATGAVGPPKLPLQVLQSANSGDPPARARRRISPVKPVRSARVGIAYDRGRPGNGAEAIGPGCAMATPRPTYNTPIVAGNRRQITSLP
jgi:hypothetical protein